MPGQRLPAILRWHLSRDGKDTERKMARSQANTPHAPATRSLHTVNRRSQMPSVFFSVMASPQGKHQRQRWHHARRKLTGIPRRQQMLYRSLVTADRTQSQKIRTRVMNVTVVQVWGNNYFHCANSAHCQMMRIGAGRNLLPITAD